MSGKTCAMILGSCSTYPHVGAIAPVNVYGVPPAMEAIARLAKGSGAKVVYDNCHGFGTQQGGVRLAAGADVQTFSFHATKVLPAIEGGLVVSNDAALVEEIRRLRSHGLRAELLASTPGYNARMDELRAATALHSLARFEGVLARRRSYARRLRRFVDAECGGRLLLQRVPEGVASNFQNFPVVVPETVGIHLDSIIDELARNGVEGRRYFHPPLHQLDA